MKKFFALALAVAMVASMAAVSFAAYSPYNVAKGIGTSVKEVTVAKDKNDNPEFYPIVDAVGPFGYSNDDKMLTDSGIEYGETAYYALIESKVTNPTDLSLVTKADTVSGLKIKAKWEEGSKLVKSVSIVKKKVMNPEGTAIDDKVTNKDKVYKGMGTLLTGSTEDYGYEKDHNYYYFVAVAVESSSTTSDADIIGTLTLNKTKAPKVSDLVLDISLNVDWAESYRNVGEYDVTGDIDDLEAETYYALKFSADEEVAIGFKDESVFTVDVSGQSKLLVYYDTKFNSKIAAKYPLAELNFWNGNGAKFNRVGEMFIPVKEDYAQFLYQLNEDGTLSEIAGAEYDKYDGGFYFYTRVLGTFVISDMELDVKPVTTPTVEAPAVTAPVVTNPSTGAAA